MECEIRIYHYGTVIKTLGPLTEKEARIEYFSRSDNESTFTELVVNGVPFKTWEAEEFLGWDEKRAISFGKSESIRRAKEKDRVRRMEASQKRVVSISEQEAKQKEARRIINGTAKRKEEKTAEQRREERRRYYNENRDKINEKRAIYRDLNRTKIRAQARAAYERRKAERKAKENEEREHA